MGPENINAEFLAFEESRRDDHLLREAEIKAQYRDYCDGLRDSYLDEVGE